MARPYEKYWNPITGEFTPEYEAYAKEVAKTCPNFDCNQVALAMDAGLSPVQCADQANQAFGEAETKYVGDPLDFDYSMNGAALDWNAHLQRLAHLLPTTPRRSRKR